MAANLYQIVLVFFFSFLPSFSPYRFGLYLTSLQGLTMSLTTLIIPCSKLSKHFTCHFILNFYSWVSGSGLDCILQSVKINPIHHISLIFMIKFLSFLAKVGSFTDATIPKKNILPADSSPAHPPQIEIAFKMLCEFIIYQLGILN